MVRSAGVLALCFGWVFAPQPGVSRAEAASNGVIASEEVYTTSTQCSNRATLRDQADGLDAQWRADAAAPSYEIGMVGTGAAMNPTPNPTPISFAGTPIVVNVSKHDLLGADVTSMANGSWGTVDVSSPADPSLATSATLQDCGPRPARLYNATPAERSVVWNATAGGGSTLDAVLFDFSVPVAAFGAWFADVETSTEGSLAYIKLFDPSDAVIAIVPLYSDRVVPLPGDPSGRSTCGGLQSDDALACGNQATRYLGFSYDNPTVSKMLVVVGDDDDCDEFPAECDGTAEHLSFVGPQLALFDDPATTTTTTTPTSTSTGPTTTTATTTTATTNPTPSTTQPATATTEAATTTQATSTQATSTTQPSSTSVGATTIGPGAGSQVLAVTGNEPRTTAGIGLLVLGHLLWRIGARGRSSMA